MLTGQHQRESQRTRASLAESRRLGLLGNPSKTGPVGSGAPAGQSGLPTILYLIFLLLVSLSFSCLLRTTTSFPRTLDRVSSAPVKALWTRRRRTRTRPIDCRKSIFRAIIRTARRSRFRHNLHRRLVVASIHRDWKNKVDSPCCHIKRYSYVMEKNIHGKREREREMIFVVRGILKYQRYDGCDSN